MEELLEIAQKHQVALYYEAAVAGGDPNPSDLGEFPCFRQGDQGSWGQWNL